MNTLRTGWVKWADFWLASEDPIRRQCFERLIVLALLLYVAAKWRWASEWLTTVGYHPSLAAANPFLAPPVPPIPPQLLPFFGLVLFTSMLAVLVGLCPQWAIWLVLGSEVYMTLVDRNSAFTINKLFFISLLILAVAPRGKNQEPVSVWPVRVLQATLLIQYFTAGWCKAVHGDWLNDSFTLWSQMQGHYRTEFGGWLLCVVPNLAWPWIQHAALVFELTAPLLIGLRRLRPFGLCLGLGFHLIIAMAFHQLIYFSFQMICFYVLFVDPLLLKKLTVTRVFSVLQSWWTARRYTRARW